MKRLNTASLASLNPDVRVPAYERAALKPGIVHLGLGAFHRAHQAVFTEQAIANSGGDWGIIGVSLRSENVSRQLLPQDCLYSVMSEDALGCELQLIGAIVDVLVAQREPHRVIAAIASEQIKIITLTITEKGYMLSGDGQSLDLQANVIASDLADPDSPVSAIGMLALGLRERWRNGAAALTIISCDNLSENSTLLRSLLVDYLAQSFPDVLPWLQQSVAFPCSMVDRIVPAMEPVQSERQAELLGVRDEAAVSTEPFNQWIIENSFAGDRPDWESAGVQLVENIVPYEDIKLRLLNASHSAIAYAGLLGGIETVDRVMADPVLREFVQRLMREELMPALDVPRGFDLDAYSAQLLARFSNPRLRHRCRQIAMDGSEKISQRWLPTLQSSPDAALLQKALANWCYFVLYTDLAIDDPRSEALIACRRSDDPLPDRIKMVLACARLTAETLDNFEQLCETLQSHIGEFLC